MSCIEPPPQYSMHIHNLSRLQVNITKPYCTVFKIHLEMSQKSWIFNNLYLTSCLGDPQKYPHNIWYEKTHTLELQTDGEKSRCVIHLQQLTQIIISVQNWWTTRMMTTHTAPASSAPRHKLSTNSVIPQIAAIICNNVWVLALSHHLYLLLDNLKVITWNDNSQHIQIPWINTF